MLNKYHINDATNETAYDALHGKEASEKLAYFGERVFFHIPARRRANLDLRWSSGIFLGTLMTSNEALVGLPNGDVIRTSSVARLIPSQRWKPEAILAITGTPARPTAQDDADSIIEYFANPHLLIDSEQRAALDDESKVDVELHLCLHVDRRLPSLRITKGDLDRYGYTDECPRCTHTKMGVVHHINSNHWDSCRRRVYRQMFQAQDPKLTKWLREHPTDSAKQWPR